MDYKQALIDLIVSVNDMEFLEYLFRFAKRLKWNWLGDGAQKVG